MIIIHRSLNSQLNYKNFYGYIEDASGFRGVFHIDKDFPEIKFQLFLHDLNASKNKLFSCSLWEINLTDDAINNHMENDLGLICSLDEFAVTFKDTILASDRLAIKHIDQGIYDKARIQLLLTYHFGSITILQGTLELELIQSNLHPNIFEMLYSISKVNTLMKDATSSTCTNQLNGHLNTTVILQENHHDTPKCNIKLLKKKRLITGGTKLYPNRKLNIN